MEKGREASFFLGANTPDGFYSLYDGFTSVQDGDFLWVIKGGPGCGKSSFMRRIGAAVQRAGLDVEYIYCSGDPKSLDGIYIPAHRTAYVDGTAPHVMDPAYPGAGGMYLDLGRFYDREALQPQLSKLLECTDLYKAQYRRAYNILAAAGGVAPHAIPGLTEQQDVLAALRRASGTIAREIKKQPGGHGPVIKRFLSAFTCEGPIFLDKTITALCQRVYTLDNGCGLANDYLQAVADAAQQRGHAVILCPNAMFPERLEAVLLPSLSLGFLALDSQRDWNGPVTRHIRLDAIPDAQRLRALRPRLRSSSKIYGQLLHEAQTALASAKALHDDLEKLYNPYVDFDGIYHEADLHIARLLS